MNEACLSFISDKSYRLADKKTTDGIEIIFKKKLLIN